jgi:ribose transport system substrate-binding protein
LRSGKLRNVPAFTAVAAAAIAAAACATSSAATRTAQARIGSAAAAAWQPNSSQVDKSYNGVDKRYMTKPLPAPKLKHGVKFKVGFLQINGTVKALAAQEQAAAAEVKALGGSLVELDAIDNPQQQVNQMKEMLDEGVTALIADPLVPQALSADFKQAQSKGIPVITVLADPQSSPTLTPGVTTDIDNASDYSVYVTMKQLAASLPKGASFGIVGFAAPVPSLIYAAQRQEYWGKHFGMKFVGQVNATVATGQAEATAATTFFTQHPSVRALITFNDATAQAAVTSAKVAHVKNVAIVTPNGGEPESVPLLKNGSEKMVYRAPWEQEGAQAVIAAYDAQTKQHLPLPKILQLPGVVATKSNLSSIPFVS